MATTSNRTNSTQTTVTVNSALDLALDKIASVDVSQGKTIALAYSGGLDSTLCVKLSETKYHAKTSSRSALMSGRATRRYKRASSAPKSSISHPLSLMRNRSSPSNG